MQVKYLEIFGKHRLLSAQQKFCPQSVSSEHLWNKTIVKCQRDKIAMPTNCYRSCYNIFLIPRVGRGTRKNYQLLMTQPWENLGPNIMATERDNLRQKTELINLN